jgi:rifampicin phosphotransferase
VNAFLNEWGFRCSGELMLTVPSFQERPAALVEILQAYAQLDGESPAERLERQEQERKAESARILNQLSGRWLAWFLPWPRKSFVARCLLRWTQQAIVCRERARLKQSLLYSRLRRIALAIGDQWVARQLLSQRDDVFFLTASELESILAGGAMHPNATRELVAVRQAAHAEVTRATPPDTFSLPAGSYWQPSASDSSRSFSENAEATLQGMGVCGGKASAPAAVLGDVTEFARLTQGNILVTRQTDPGWGPVFPLIQGLVIERGGMLSHGAILAREYGLPTVVGIANATQRIRSGQTVTVDGDRGLVELH